MSLEMFHPILRARCGLLKYQLIGEAFFRMKPAHSIPLGQLLTSSHQEADICWPRGHKGLDPWMGLAQVCGFPDYWVSKSSSKDVHILKGPLPAPVLPGDSGNPASATWSPQRGWCEEGVGEDSGMGLYITWMGRRWEEQPMGRMEAWFPGLTEC